MPLLGVLHEKLGAADFQPFLSAPLYYDPDKIFFGPKQRRLGLLGFFRLDVWMNIYRYDLGQVRNVQSLLSVADLKRKEAVRAISRVMGLFSVVYTLSLLETR